MLPLVSHCGDYRLECLQASAHVRAHFGMDGRRQDNKAIRACVHAYGSYERGTAWYSLNELLELQMPRTELRERMFDNTNNLFLETQTIELQLHAVNGTSYFNNSGMKRILEEFILYKIYINKMQVHKYKLNVNNYKLIGYQSY